MHRDLGFRYDYGNIVGQSDSMKSIFKVLDQVSDTDIPVLVYGESGTGKELIAKACHFNSARKNKPFVSENCAAIPENLLESELFGHTQGSFTGATRDKEGLLRHADGGTVFLDEIGDLPLALQSKLLRVLQEKVIRPVGAKEWIPVDIRIVSATNKNLEALIKQEKFREDLYYRLNGLKIELPPLRERREDIPLLINFFSQTFSKQYKKTPCTFTREALHLLMDYSWPGNIRELENTVRNAFLFSAKTIDVKNLEFKKELFAPEVLTREFLLQNIHEWTDEKEKIVHALKAHNYNKVETARFLGMSRKTLYNKMGSYKISTKRLVTYV